MHKFQENICAIFVQNLLDKNAIVQCKRKNLNVPTLNVEPIAFYAIFTKIIKNLLIFVHFHNKHVFSIVHIAQNYIIFNKKNLYIAQYIKLFTKFYIIFMQYIEK